MRIAFMPAGGEEVASARLRAHALAKALTALGEQAAVDADVATCDVLVVQKRIDAGVVEIAEAAHKRRSLVLYDADDVGPALDYWAPRRLRRRLLACTDGLISDTDVHLAELMRLGRGLPGAVVPDMVDYGATAPSPPADVPQPPLRILWFGSVSNIHLLIRRLPVLTGMPDTEVVACTSLPPGSDLPSRWPAVRWEPWTADGFTTLLRSCHISLLAHDGGVAARGKSDNRLVASLVWGVPVAATRTPAYLETASAAGIADCLFEDDAGLSRTIERLRDPHARRDMVRLAQPVVWTLRSPETVARRFLAAVGAISAAPRRPPAGILSKLWRLAGVA
jgi:hypothetical protein